MNARQRAGQRPRPGPYRGPGWAARLVLGVDVGGVIVDRIAAGEDTSFFGLQPLATPATDGVFDALARLSAGVFEGRVHVVSKAGPKVAANTRAWLAHHDFFGRIRMSEANLHFVRERADKAPVCSRLGITHFVDDRLDVLGHLVTVGNRYLFTGGLGEEPVPDRVPDWATTADSWPVLVELIEASAADIASPARRARRR